MAFSAPSSAGSSEAAVADAAESPRLLPSPVSPITWKDVVPGRADLAGKPRDAAAIRAEDADAIHWMIRVDEEIRPTPSVGESPTSGWAVPSPPGWGVPGGPPFVVVCRLACRRRARPAPTTIEPPKWTPEQEQALSRILVTGASSGLGLLTATALADAGHDVVLHARNASRITDPAIAPRMQDVVYGDLAQPEEVRQVAAQAQGIGRFDAVIHNAGVYTGSSMLAVNVAASYLMTALMDRPDRIIVLSSSDHFSGSPYLTKPLRGSEVSYSDSKLYVTALAFALARRWPGNLVHAVDPGWVPTRMGGPSAPDSLDEGHPTQEWLATADPAEITPRSGGYWHHKAARRANPAAYDEAFQDELLDSLDQMTGVALPS